MYRKDYFEAIDLAVNCIQDRFQQAGYIVYKNLEQLLLKASINSDFSAEFTFVTSFYGEDLQAESLRAQLLTFAIEFKRVFSETSSKHTVYDIKKFFFHYLQPRKVFCVRSALC